MQVLLVTCRRITLNASVYTIKGLIVGRYYSVDVIDSHSSEKKIIYIEIDDAEENITILPDSCSLMLIAYPLVIARLSETERHMLLELFSANGLTLYSADRVSTSNSFITGDCDENSLNNRVSDDEHHVSFTENPLVSVVHEHVEHNSAPIYTIKNKITWFNQAAKLPEQLWNVVKMNPGDASICAGFVLVAVGLILVFMSGGGAAMSIAGLFIAIGGCGVMCGKAMYPEDDGYNLR